MVFPGVRQLVQQGVGDLGAQIDPGAGLFLPLKVQVYEDASGRVWLAYEDPKETMDKFDEMEKSPVIDKMRGALAKLTSAAAE